MTSAKWIVIAALLGTLAAVFALACTSEPTPTPTPSPTPSSVTRLTNQDTTDWSPTWSSNSQRIAFTSERD